MIEKNKKLHAFKVILEPPPPMRSKIKVAFHQFLLNGLLDEKPKCTSVIFILLDGIIYRSFSCPIDSSIYHE